MGNSELVVTNLRTRMHGRKYTWLASETNYPYKRILAEVKHSSRPLSLDVAVASAHALGCELPDLMVTA